MTQPVTFTSPRIAEEMLKRFGTDKSQTRTFTVELKYKDEVNSFLKKINTAHKEAGKGTQRFKA